MLANDPFWPGYVGAREITSVSVGSAGGTITISPDRKSVRYAPAEIAAGKAAVGQPIRLGGMVSEGSLERLPDGVTVRFRLNDGPSQVPVEFRGILPDLFREGSGAVAEGRLRADGTFAADNILAKHDERYMPPELGNLAAEHEAAKTVER